MKTFYFSLIAVTIFLLVLGSALLIIFGKPIRTSSISRTKKIAYVSVLTALCTIANVYSLPILGDFSISFIMIPCFIAGYMFGYIEGFAVGFIGDLIGCIVAPKGIFSPVLIIASGLWGFIPGVIFSFIKGNDYIKTIVCTLFGLIICTAFLNTFGLWYLYAMTKKTFWVYLIGRLPWQSIVTVVNGAICLGLLPLLKKLVPKIS